MAFQAFDYELPPEIRVITKLPNSEQNECCWNISIDEWQVDYQIREVITFVEELSSNFKVKVWYFTKNIYIIIIYECDQFIHMWKAWVDHFTKRFDLNLFCLFLRSFYWTLELFREWYLCLSIYRKWCNCRFLFLLSLKLDFNINSDYVSIWHFTFPYSSSLSCFWFVFLKPAETENHIIRMDDSSYTDELIWHLSLLRYLETETCYKPFKNVYIDTICGVKLSLSSLLCS